MIRKKQNGETKLFRTISGLLANVRSVKGKANELNTFETQYVLQKSTWMNPFNSLSKSETNNKIIIRTGENILGGF